MSRYRLGGLIGLSVTLALAGCSSTGSRTHLNPAIPAPRIPATSPLSACVDPSPAKAKPADAAIAKHFTDGRITSTLSLDGGQFRATPPADSAKPEIDAALAYCNLLAGIDSSNRGVIESIPAHGVSFGLGVLTVDKSLAQIDQGFHAVGPGGTPLPTPQANLTPYAKRLAWIAVFEPDQVFNCPVGIVPDGKTPPTTASTKRLPGYQILAIDADTGANGIRYSATTNSPCGEPGTRDPSYTPAKVFVSVPWTLTTRGTDPTRATIAYAARPCDDRSNLVYDSASEKPAVFLTRDHPGLVDVTLERTLTTCGPAVQVPVMLRGEYPKDDVPERLVHAPVGALDTRD